MSVHVYVVLNLSNKLRKSNKMRFAKHFIVFSQVK